MKILQNLQRIRAKLHFWMHKIHLKVTHLKNLIDYGRLEIERDRAYRNL